MIVLPLRIVATMTLEQIEWMNRNYSRLDQRTRDRLYTMLDDRGPVQEAKREARGVDQ